MDLRIELKSWKIGWKKDDDKKSPKVIGGEYVVMCGSKVIASKDFNLGYGAVMIQFPASMMVRAEELDKEIKTAIENFLETSQ